MYCSVADAKGFVYERVRGPKRNIEFEPRSGGFEQVEAVWNGYQWRVTGREIVTTRLSSLPAVRR
jgi:hypothetical protein